MMSAYAPYGGDSYDDDGGGHPDWPPNLKLKAVQEIKVKAEGVESLKTALDTEAWDSPAAEGYRVWVTGGIDAVATMLSCIVEDLTSAENVQLTYPGKRAEPGSPEATWRQAQ